MVILNYRAGQLANRLFYFSHFISNSIEHGYELVNPTFNDYKDYFISTSKNDFGNLKLSLHITSKNTVDDLIVKSANVVKKVIFDPFRNTPFYRFHNIRNSDTKGVCFDMNDSDFINSAKRKTVFIDGWLYRDFKNFAKYSDVLRQVFTPLPHYSEAVTQTINNCRAKGDTVIGVHIRRGDYRTYRNGEWFYDDNIYYGAMKSIEKAMKAQGKSCVFLICSNEDINTDNFKGLNIAVEKRHFIVDLYSLAKCDYIFGPPSTYTMWASFYGKVPLYTMHKPETELPLSDFQVFTKG